MRRQRGLTRASSADGLAERGEERAASPHRGSQRQGRAAPSGRAAPGARLILHAMPGTCPGALRRSQPSKRLLHSCRASTASRTPSNAACAGGAFCSSPSPRGRTCRASAASVRRRSLVSRLTSSSQVTAGLRRKCQRPPSSGAGAPTNRVTRLAVRGWCRFMLRPKR